MVFGLLLSQVLLKGMGEALTVSMMQQAGPAGSESDEQDRCVGRAMALGCVCV